MTEQYQPKTFAEIMTDIWQARFFIACGLCIAVFCAVTLQTTAIKHHRSSMIVAPANPMNGAEASSLLADDNLFALRYIMQRVGAGNSTDFVQFESIYNGARVAEILLDDQKIRSGLEIDRSFSFEKPENQWTAALLAKYINKRVRLEPLGATSLRRMTYGHANSEFASYFLYKLHKATDNLIRTKIRTDSAQRIDYLEKTIRQTRNPEHKRALTTLLMEQERLKMLVSLDIPYAAAIIEPPASQAKPDWPPLLLMWSALLAIGTLLGFVAAQIKGQKTQNSPENQENKEWFKPTARNENQSLSTEKQKLSYQDKKSSA